MVLVEVLTTTIGPLRTARDALPAPGKTSANDAATATAAASRTSAVRRRCRRDPVSAIAATARAYPNRVHARRPRRARPESPRPGRHGFAANWPRAPGPDGRSAASAACCVVRRSRGLGQGRRLGDERDELGESTQLEYALNLGWPRKDDESHPELRCPVRGTDGEMNARRVDERRLAEIKDNDLVAAPQPGQQRFRDAAGGVDVDLAPRCDRPRRTSILDRYLTYLVHPCTAPAKPPIRRCEERTAALATPRTRCPRTDWLIDGVIAVVVRTNRASLPTWTATVSSSARHSTGALSAVRRVAGADGPTHDDLRARASTRPVPRRSRLAPRSPRGAPPDPASPEHRPAVAASRPSRARAVTAPHRRRAARVTRRHDKVSLRPACVRTTGARRRPRRHRVKYRRCSRPGPRGDCRRPGLVLSLTSARDGQSMSANHSDVTARTSLRKMVICGGASLRSIGNPE